MLTAETVAVWVAVFLYAAASVLFILGLAFARATWSAHGHKVALVGAAVHAAGIVVRWIRVGHGPTLGFHEVASGMALVSVALFLWIVWRYEGFRPVGALLMPIAFLMMGGSMLVSREADSLSGALASTWLVIHVAFANLAYGAYVAAFVLSAAYLLREYGRQGRLGRLLDRLPAQEVIDGVTFRFVGAGFVFQGIMIASGAIWANEAWGRYWGWDPMEIWSLIAWAVYALYLHLTLTLGWRGRRAAWVAVLSLPVIVFSLLGVPLVYNSIHGAYLRT